jgi:hypothetical protein
MKIKLSTKPEWANRPREALNFSDAHHDGCCQQELGGSKPPS